MVLILLLWYYKILFCFSYLFYFFPSQVPRKFTSKVERKMGYEDFVYFVLSEEDKSSEPSLEYWYFNSPNFLSGILLYPIVIKGYYKII